MSNKWQSNIKNSDETEKVTAETTIETKASSSSVAMHDMLGEKLRAYYDEVAKEPVPDRFAELLKELENRSSTKKTK